MKFISEILYGNIQMIDIGSPAVCWCSNIISSLLFCCRTIVYPAQCLHIYAISSFKQLFLIKIIIILSDVKNSTESLFLHENPVYQCFSMYVMCVYTCYYMEFQHKYQNQEISKKFHRLFNRK